VQTPPTTEPIEENWTRRGVGMSGVELLTLTPAGGGHDRDYLFSLIDGSLNSDQQLDQLAVDASRVVEQLNWCVKAMPLLAELARHVFTLTDGGASISLPLATETDLCLAIQALGDLATPPFDTTRPIFVIVAGNDLDIASDQATGFPTMCADAGAAIIRPGDTDGVYDHSGGLWRLRLQLRDGLELEAWVTALGQLWRERLGDVEMSLEVGQEGHGIRLIRTRI
jgi:hypothetical protein